MIGSILMVIFSPIQAQTETQCVRQDSQSVNCKTRIIDPVSESYSKALGLMPQAESYQDQELKKQQIKRLELQNDLLRRQLQVQAAPGFDKRQCGRSAKAAIDGNDLGLARDILNACTGQR